MNRVKRKKQSNFVKQLYSILENQQNKKYIFWLEDETTFAIVDKRKFAENILIKYFRHAKYSSFLSMYGFKKVPNESNLICYSHPEFSRQKVNFEIPKQQRIQDPSQLEIYNPSFNDIIQELKSISQSQIEMCSQLEQCKAMQTYASNQIGQLNAAMLLCLVRKKQADEITALLMKLVNGMKSQLQTNIQQLYDELFPCCNFQNLQLSELATPISYQFSPIPLINKKQFTHTEVRQLEDQNKINKENIWNLNQCI